MVARSLAANDRVKYLLTLLQTARGAADGAPEHEHEIQADDDEPREHPGRHRELRDSPGEAIGAPVAAARRQRQKERG